ncbi:MAG: AzlC family ABC transporter permease [Limnochordia bacterium]
MVQLTAREAFGVGVRQAVPIMFGYGPIGVAYGVLARQAGLTLAQTVAMSIFVYAGSSQFIAAGMLGAGAGFLPVVSTTLLVNLRHLLMSAALSPHLGGLRRSFLGLYSPSTSPMRPFALHSANLDRGPAHPWLLLGINLASYGTWVLSSLVGGLFGSILPDPARLGLDFALPAMFIALLVVQLKGPVHVLVGGAAGAVSVVVALLLARQLERSPGEHPCRRAGIGGVDLARAVHLDPGGDGPGHLLCPGCFPCSP